MEEARDALKHDPNDPLFSRAVMPKAKLPKLPPIEGLKLYRYRGREGGTITGMLYTDGSMKWMVVARFSSCG